MPKRTLNHHTWLIDELRDPQTASNYLTEAYSDSPKMFLVALRNVSEAWRMSLVASKAGVGRESLYKTLSKRGNPGLYTLDAVLRAIGIKIEFQPEKATSVQPAPATTPVALREVHAAKEKGNGGFQIAQTSLRYNTSGNCSSGITVTLTAGLPTSNNTAIIGGFPNNATAIYPLPDKQLDFQTAPCGANTSRHILSAGDRNQQEGATPAPIPEYGWQSPAPYNPVQHLTQ